MTSGRRVPWRREGFGGPNLFGGQESLIVSLIGALIIAPCATG